MRSAIAAVAHRGAIGSSPMGDGPSPMVDGSSTMANAVYVALGVTRDGQREVLGLWIAESWRDQKTVRGTVFPTTVPNSGCR